MERFFIGLFLCLLVFVSCTPANVVAPGGGDDGEIVDVDCDGYTNQVDCNDGNVAVYPKAVELDNGIDDDCDNLIDEGFHNDGDVDGDGYTTDPQDCNDQDASIHPGATEVCNDEKDNDCDGAIDGADSQCQSSTPTPTPSYDGSEVTITVAYGSATPAVDFSFGY